jgi:pSer/pThr/pTyr-binding forkhead associated (FHA) protein
MDVSLVMFKADGTRRDFPIKKPKFIVGRTTHCDLRIPLSSVSRKHCEIRMDGNRVHLRDLGSSNGTYHNSARVLEVTLKAGDEIAIGPVVFTLVIDGQPGQITPVRPAAEPATASPDAKQPASRSPEKPTELKIPDDHEISAIVEPEEKTPTADLDDDPIAALEALAKNEEQEQTGADIPLLVDDDEDPPATHK